VGFIELGFSLCYVIWTRQKKLWVNFGYSTYNPRVESSTRPTSGYIRDGNGSGSRQVAQKSARDHTAGAILNPHSRVQF
jgi:hypothetical protein